MRMPRPLRKVRPVLTARPVRTAQPVLTAWPVRQAWTARSERGAGTGAVCATQALSKTPRPTRRARGRWVSQLGMGGARLAAMFKALVCFALFFIAVGAAGMWLAEQRRKMGGGPRR